MAGSRGRPVGAKDRAAEAKPFSVRPVPANEGGGWLVKQGSNWYRVKELSLLAPALSCGDCLMGDGVLTRKGETAVITA